MFLLLWMPLQNPKVTPLLDEALGKLNEIFAKSSAD
jgi:hypothetical protein